ncbi:MAG: hypothetical protein AAF933_06385 [Pseudomonadota bacterium]
MAGALLGTGSLLGGCAAQLPCMHYEAQTFTRTISMRGYGTLQYDEERLVCTERATGTEAGIFGP